jgi:hypothetical protein
MMEWPSSVYKLTQMHEHCSSCLLKHHRIVDCLFMQISVTCCAPFSPLLLKKKLPEIKCSCYLCYWPIYRHLFSVFCLLYLVFAFHILSLINIIIISRNSVQCERARECFLPMNKLLQILILVQQHEMNAREIFKQTIIPD